MNKLKQISDSGKTIMFVSHNLNSVRRLCDTAILLDKGRLLLKDNVENIISEYISLNKKIVPIQKIRREDIDISLIKVVDVNIVNENEKSQDIFPVTGRIGIVLTFEVKEELINIFTQIKLFSSSGIHIFNAIDPKGSIFNRTGIFQRTVWIGENMLNEDTYYVKLSLITPPYENPKIHLTIDNLASFEAAFNDSDISAKGGFKNKWSGVIVPKLIWTD